MPATLVHLEGEMAMRVEELHRLYDYGYWANAQLFQALSQLTPEEFTRSVAGSYGSIRNSLVHTVSAEWGWLDRCGGPKRGPKLEPGDYATLQAVVAASTKVEAMMREFLAGLTDDDLARRIEFSVGDSASQSASLGLLLLHAAIHAVHHRGQVALLVRVLGYAPGNFDLLVYDIVNGPPG